MIIECGSCKTRFRLDASKITGRGARVRCRKCGEAITVMKPDIDGQAGPVAAPAAERDEGLDLRSILRETMDVPVTRSSPAESPAGIDALQSDFEKMFADAAKEADLEVAAPRVAEPPAPALGGDDLRSAEGTGAAAPADERAPREPGWRERPGAVDGGSGQEPGAQEQPQAGGQAVDFGPEEELTFQQPAPVEPAATDERAPREPEPRDWQAGGEVGSGRGRQAPERPAVPDSSPGFVMSTADALDFLRTDYDRGEQRATLDISGNLRIAPAPGAREEKLAPPLGTQAAGAGGAEAAAAAPPAEPPARSDAIRSELAGPGGAEAAGASAGRGWPSAPSPADRQAPREPQWREPPGAGGGGTAAAPPRPTVAAPTPSPAVLKAPARRSPPLKQGQGSQLVRPSIILLLILFLAVAGGGAYLGFTSDGQRVLRGLVPRIESFWLGGGKPASRYEVGNLVGYYETGAAAGRIFVIKGQVTNEGQVRKTGVRIYAALLDSQNRKLAERTIYAGNVLTGDALRKAGKEKIEAAMSNPIGGGLANMDIPPGKSVPFMVVFFDAPDGIDSYRLEPKDVD